MTEGAHMGTAAKPTRENRTITADFQNEATYFQLLGDGKAFLECVLAFLLSLGFHEFIPIKPSAATSSDGPGSYAGHSTVPSRDRGRRCHLTHKSAEIDA